MEVDCDSATISFDDTFVGTGYEAIEDELSTEFEDGIKAYIETELGPELEAAINTAARNAKTNLGLFGGVPILMQFYRDAAEERIVTLEKQATGLVNTLQQSANYVVNKWATRARSFVSN